MCMIYPFYHHCARAFPAAETIAAISMLASLLY